MTEHTNNKKTDTNEISAINETKEAIEPCVYCDTNLPCLRLECDGAQKMLERLKQQVQPWEDMAKRYEKLTPDYKKYATAVRKSVLECLSGLLSAHNIAFTESKLIHLQGNIKTEYVLFTC